MSALRIKKGDTVKIIAGSHKGTVARVVGVQPSSRRVLVEGVGLQKRHRKPSMLNPQGGVVDIHTAIDVSKVALVSNDTSKATSRVGYTHKKDGSKVRVYKKTNKEIDA